MSKYNVIKFQAPFERLKEYNLSPEVRLYKSIIIQAIIDVSNKSDDSKAKKHEMEAKTWIFGNSDHFNEVCNKAELSSDEVIEMARFAININGNLNFYFSPRLNEFSGYSKLS